MNYDGGKKTVCPFYERESKYRIMCEGLIDFTQFSLVFASENHKKEYQQAVCFSFDNYRDCPFVMLFSEKYD